MNKRMTNWGDGSQGDTFPGFSDTLFDLSRVTMELLPPRRLEFVRGPTGVFIRGSALGVWDR